jgi:hypothetical protein
MSHPWKLEDLPAPPPMMPESERLELARAILRNPGPYPR